MKTEINSLHAKNELEEKVIKLCCEFSSKHHCSISLSVITNISTHTVSPVEKITHIKGIEVESKLTIE